MTMIKPSAALLLLLALTCLLALAHGQVQEDFSAAASGDAWSYEEWDFKQQIASEKQVGLTAPLPQVNAPAPPKNPKLEGTPGMSPAMGPNDAPVRVYIFSDFQCPNCARAVEPLKYLVRDMRPHVQVIFKQYPLPSHGRAKPAAAASYAAALQGKYWEYHDLLFQNMRSLQDDDLVGYAKQLGLDMDKWTKDWKSDEVADIIRYDVSLGNALGVTGTPAFVVAGKLSVGWGSLMGIRMPVERALNSGGGGKDSVCQVEGYPCNGH